ncbi:MAG: HD domain-containing protein [Bdellovibrionales bacterium]|jgi:HD-GYP domain-containing protein (c-di-GMP phosphodiesterase class II)|nr:HD domain-containing protein [Bdellovibrionales bacterium]MBT3526669.1 HD domain-containing protein [Bdellovibrionales bacterium]MBT7670189.1 HD domain-containing protein [Bdellovibrionales bacterium]MBT7767794.1 HD domain-containing protein [Bdellovibrionales bacterium]
MSSDPDEFKQIELQSILPNQVLGFDIFIFMPINGKYISYISGKDPVDENRLKRLKFKKVNFIYIRQEDLAKYSKYISSAVRDKLSQKGGQNKREAIISSAEMIINSVDMLSGDDDLVDWSNNCVEVTKAVVDEIVKTKELSNAYDKIMDFFSSNPSIINHSLAVSSLGVVISMALGNFSPRTLTEVAYGGLVHDVGLGDVSEKIIEKYLRSEQMNSEESKIFKEHPDNGVRVLSKIIKSKNITDNVLKIVYEHHEMWDGSGYPQGIAGPTLAYLPKIITIADRIALAMQKPESSNKNFKYILLKLQQEQDKKRTLDKRMLTSLLQNL